MFDRLPLLGFVAAFAGFIALGAAVSRKSPPGRAGGLLIIAVGLVFVGVHAIVSREWRWGRALSRTRRGAGAVARGVFCIACAAAAAYAAWWTLGQP
jgi:hypothetical protein